MPSLHASRTRSRRTRRRLWDSYLARIYALLLGSTQSLGCLLDRTLCVNVGPCFRQQGGTLPHRDCAFMPLRTKPYRSTNVATRTALGLQKYHRVAEKTLLSRRPAAGDTYEEPTEEGGLELVCRIWAAVPQTRADRREPQNQSEIRGCPAAWGSPLRLSGPSGQAHSNPLQAQG